MHGISDLKLFYFGNVFRSNVLSLPEALRYAVALGRLTASSRAAAVFRIVIVACGAWAAACCLGGRFFLAFNSLLSLSKRVGCFGMTDERRV